MFEYRYRQNLALENYIFFLHYRYCFPQFGIPMRFRQLNTFAVQYFMIGITEPDHF